MRPTQPIRDSEEFLLLQLFLRRYITYCARASEICRNEWRGAVVPKSANVGRRAKQAPAGEWIAATGGEL